MTDVRRERRKTLGYPATVTAPGLAPIPCVVLDVSNNGARLGAKAALPDKFTLMLSAKGALRDCEVMWRREQEVGVKFVRRANTAAPVEVPAPLAIEPAPSSTDAETVLI